MKLKITLGVMLIIICAFAFIPYVQGIYLERSYKEHVERLNHGQNFRENKFKPIVGLHLKVVNYERGWFSSKALLEVQFHNEPLYDETSQLNSRVFKQKVVLTIQHGPLTYTEKPGEGRKFFWGLGVVKGKVKLVLPNKKLTKQIKPIITYTEVDFDGKSQVLIYYPQTRYNEGGVIHQLSAIKFRLRQVGGSLIIESDPISYQSGNNEVIIRHINFKMRVNDKAQKKYRNFLGINLYGLKFKSEKQKTMVPMIQINNYWDEAHRGSGILRIPSVSAYALNDLSQPTVSVKNFRVKKLWAIRANRIGESNLISLDEFIIKGKKVGPIKFGFSIFNINILKLKKAVKVIAKNRKEDGHYEHDKENERYLLSILSKVKVRNRVYFATPLGVVSTYGYVKFPALEQSTVTPEKVFKQSQGRYLIKISKALYEYYPELSSTLKVLNPTLKGRYYVLDLKLNRGAFYSNAQQIYPPAPPPKEEMLSAEGSNINNGRCQIACYSRDPGVRSVGQGIFYQGGFSVPGRYLSGACRPSGYGLSDISKVQEFKDMCNQKITACALSKTGGCWAGGDT